MIAFAAGEEDPREVPPDAPEPVPSSPSQPLLPAPTPAPFMGWGWAAELMAAVEPFLSQNAINQNIPGEGAAPPQADAPAEVPHADLEPSDDSESEEESSSSFEESNGASEGGGSRKLWKPKFLFHSFE